MYMYRWFMSSILVAVLAVSYVHQRVEIIKVGYNLQKNRRHLAHLVDRNSDLMYNLSKLESPGNLLTLVNADEIEFAGRRTRLSDRYVLTRADYRKDVVKTDLIGRVMDVFLENAEARSHR